MRLIAAHSIIPAVDGVFGNGQTLPTLAALRASRWRLSKRAIVH